MECYAGRFLFPGFLWSSKQLSSRGAGLRATRAEKPEVLRSAQQEVCRVSIVFC